MGMRTVIYFSFLISALVCSLVHVVKQSRLETSPGEIVLHAFFVCFTFIGISSVWWILAVKNEMSQAFGVLFNGLFLGAVTLLCMRLTFYLNRHRDAKTNTGNSHEHPHFI
ncbi:hypothetical protein [Bacillus sp. B-jedd]|uniref:hypothetical protein n=1 Tax=Bacillus sp. B-jedd TaxID=1476857 RepID=UPI0005156E08|nr:hypothetical protein [Bacillus sp. B-jedd]CEG27367.1 hypothetical protein BN1002_02227 [Bacillus sp. B-jedd]